MCDRHENYIEPEESPEERAERERSTAEAQYDTIKEEFGSIQEFRNWLEDDVLMLTPLEKWQQNN